MIGKYLVILSSRNSIQQTTDTNADAGHVSTLTPQTPLVLSMASFKFVCLIYLSLRAAPSGVAAAEAPIALAAKV